MVELTLQIPNALARQIQPISDWLPTIIELSVANFKSSQVKKESDNLISFLSSNPKPQKVLKYKISEESQNRVCGFLEQNRNNLLKPLEIQELDEWEKFNNICITLSAKAMKLAE
jgi:hypothetical protein